MTLTVETGAGLANAESYASEAEADAYFTARGNAAWGLLSSAQQEQALRRATDYMVQTYRMRWLGWRTTNTQALDWPRTEVEMVDAPPGYYPNLNYYDDDDIPQAVKSACIELAGRAVTADLLADLGPDVDSERVDVIAVAYTLGGRKTNSFPAVDRLLAPLLTGGGGNSAVSLARR